MVGIVAAAAPLHAAEAQETKETKEPSIYTVVQGDTCAGIATRFYGDSRRVDIIHEANPGMGPSPHSLKPGTKLVLPPKPGDQVTGPDARVTRVRNHVEITAAETSPAKGNDPLFRGNRVGTKVSSAADVTFRDETQVKIGENTLIVILGDTKANATRTSGTDVTLVTGALRARLGELSGGKRTTQPRVTTDSGVVAMKDGEAQVTSDEYKTTRVAVYAGGSTLSAQKKTVPVNDGFGSKAVKGIAPTPPQLLPPPPEWTSTPGGAVIAHAPVELAFAYKAGTGTGPAPAQWHVQLARDARFDDIVLDQRAPLAVSRIEAKNLGAGTYYARVSAIDDDRFEGKWSAPAQTTVGRVGLEHLTGRRARLTMEGPSLTCTVDGSPATFPVEVDRDRAHTVACASAEASASAATLPIPMMPLGKARVSAEPLDVKGRTGTLRVTVVDGFGERVGHLRPVVEPLGDLRVNELTSAGAPGIYVGSFTWSGPPHPTPLRVRVLEGATFDTNVVAFSQEAPAPPPSQRKAGLELGAAGVGSWRGKPPIGAGFELDARAAFFLPKGVLFAGGAGGWSQLLETTRDGVSVEGSAVSMRVFVGYRFGTGTFAPYVALGPEVLRQSVEVRGATGREWLVGASGGVGLEAVVGPGAFFLEARGRAVGPTSKEEPSLTASGGLLLLGYRLRL